MPPRCRSTDRSLGVSCRLNAMFVRDVTCSSNHLRKCPQSRSGGVDLPGIESRDGGVDDLEQLRERRRACYIATRTRRSHIIRRVRHSARVPARPRFLARICAPDRSHILRDNDRTHVRLPAPPQNCVDNSQSCEGSRVCCQPVVRWTRLQIRNASRQSSAFWSRSAVSSGTFGWVWNWPCPWQSFAASS